MMPEFAQSPPKSRLLIYSGPDDNRADALKGFLCQIRVPISDGIHLEIRMFWVKRYRQPGPNITTI